MDIVDVAKWFGLICPSIVMSTDANELATFQRVLAAEFSADSSQCIVIVTIG